MKPSIVIVGLGNPGAQYERTRHNLGFLAIEALAADLDVGDWKEMQKFDAIGVESRIHALPAVLLKPTTYMNLSGNAVRKVLDFYKLDPATQLLVVTDDIDIPLGETRLKTKGGPGTHNGLKSICDIYGEDYARLRLGLGAPQHGEDLAAWVLSTPSPNEQEKIEKMIQEVPKMVKDFVLGN